MVLVRSASKKRMRRYTIFIIVGVAILILQLLLAAHFAIFSKYEIQMDENIYPQKTYDKVEEFEGGMLSAGKVRSAGSDDEDTHVATSKNKKQQKVGNNHTHLHLDELDFVPPCQISGKEAISAIHRAKTQKCKRLIANITCASQNNLLFPKQLRSTCPSGSYQTGKDIGCFKDEKSYRLLSGYYSVNKLVNSPQYCIRLCLQSGFPYAGVQYSNECFCGNDEPPSTSKLPDSSCNMKCPGDSQATCGGYYALNVYETGVKKFVAQPANLGTVGGEEPSVRIAFLLTLNGRSVRQVFRLWKILYHPKHYYYIHVDIRQDYLFRQLLVLEQRFANVRLTRKRYATIWGGASLLEMLLSCMAELIQLDEWRWDIVLNLSESDFPVKTLAQLSSFLGSNTNRNFVKSHGREVQRFIQKQGLDKTFVECETRMWRIGDRSLPAGIQLDGGSDWVALSRPFVKYVSAQLPDELVAGLRVLFKYTLLPAESFFHTVLRNSKFCNTYIDNNLHVTNWKRKLGCKCQYKHIVDWCGCSPNDFKPEDWPRIQNTLPRQIYFARKFEPIINQAVILQLELWLHGLDKPSRHVQNLHSYWQNLYHHQDLSHPADDGLFTLAHSLKRRVEKNISNATCNIKANSMKEITSYHHKDSYVFTLFSFGMSSGDDILIVEIAVKPLDNMVVMKPSPLIERLQFLSVSNDYDQKEQTSRNFLRIMSPYSDPVLIYEFTATENHQEYNISCLWIDPVGRLVEVSDVSIEQSTILGHVKPSFKQPHLPGSWLVRVIHKNTLLAEVKFLITPLEYLSGYPLKISQVGLLHGGSLPVLKAVPAKLSKFLSNGFDRDILERISFANTRKIGGDLQQWIDVLSSKFYTVEKMCAITKKNTVDLCGHVLKACANTNWSSVSPDPKSAINVLNQTTGMFTIW